MGDEDMARLKVVIEDTEVRRGNGTPGDPTRRVTVYYGTDGAVLAERDEWLEERRAEGALISGDALASLLGRTWSPWTPNLAATYIVHQNGSVSAL